MSTTPNDKPKRLSILGYKGTKSNFPENKNKTDNDIFGLRQNKSRAMLERAAHTKKVAETNIEHDMRSKSPYVNGQKNTNYVAPHFNSSLSFTNPSDNPLLKNKSTTPTASNNRTKYNIFNQEITEFKTEKKKKVEKEEPPIFGSRNLTLHASIDKIKTMTARSSDMVEAAKFNKNDKMDTIDTKNITENTDNLVCNYCVNKKIKNNILERKEREIQNENVELLKNQETQKNEDNLKNLKEKMIKDKIKQRENLSKIASDCITNGREKEKIKLQKQYENDTFILHNRSKVNKDILLANEKTKQKEIIQEGYLNRYALLSTRPEIGEYYDKCVENYTPNDEDKNRKNLKTKYTTYKDDLSKQLEVKKEIEIKVKTIDYNSYVDMVQQTQQIEERKEIEKKTRQNQMKEQFIKENELLKENKKNEEELKKLHKMKEARKAEQLKKELMDKTEKEMMDKKKKTKILMHELDKQIKEKMKNRPKSQVPEKDQDADNILIKGHSPCLVSCGQCNKKYPKNIMNKNNKNIKI